ncbi:MAG TPA: hypothetical protein VGS03_12370 [Candidatus Polarisedimenticolia bacterium]|jgi:hypothetical protein|nr:hypothetical protein [Candidatus Polarisedimenticolia bacterium]
MTAPPTDASEDCGHPAAALLDFHINGSLEGEEDAMVAAHVAQCAVCARDARELRELSAAIESHGAVAPAGWSRGRQLWAPLATAAAVIVVGAVAYQMVRPGPAQPEIPAAPVKGGAPAGVEVALDLGVGGMRDAGAGMPRIDLGRGVSTLRLTLNPPVAPDQDLLLSVVGPGEKELVGETALPPLDAMGRAAIAVPASRFQASGIYKVLLRSPAAQDGTGRFAYPFEVTVSAKQD